MNKKLMQSNDPDIAGIDAALRRAAKRALQTGLETGTPVYVLIDGKIVDLTERYRHKAKRKRRQTQGRARPGD